MDLEGGHAWIMGQGGVRKTLGWMNGQIPCVLQEVIPIGPLPKSKVIQLFVIHLQINWA